jgi:hypothetical protein
MKIFTNNEDQSPLIVGAPVEAVKDTSEDMQAYDDAASSILASQVIETTVQDQKTSFFKSIKDFFFSIFKAKEVDLPVIEENEALLGKAPAAASAIKTDSIFKKMKAALIGIEPERAAKAKDKNDQQIIKAAEKQMVTYLDSLIENYKVALENLKKASKNETVGNTQEQLNCLAEDIVTHIRGITVADTPIQNAKGDFFVVDGKILTYSDVCRRVIGEDIDTDQRVRDIVMGSILNQTYGQTIKGLKIDYFILAEFVRQEMINDPEAMIKLFEVDINTSDTEKDVEDSIKAKRAVEVTTHKIGSRLFEHTKNPKTMEKYLNDLALYSNSKISKIHADSINNRDKKHASHPARFAVKLIEKGKTKDHSDAIRNQQIQLKEDFSDLLSELEELEKNVTEYQAAKQSEFKALIDAKKVERTNRPIIRQADALSVRYAELQKLENALEQKEKKWNEVYQEKSVSIDALTKLSDSKVAIDEVYNLFYGQTPVVGKSFVNQFETYFNEKDGTVKIGHTHDFIRSANRFIAQIRKIDPKTMEKLMKIGEKDASKTMQEAHQVVIDLQKELLQLEEKEGKFVSIENASSIAKMLAPLLKKDSKNTQGPKGDKVTFGLNPIMALKVQKEVVDKLIDKTNKEVRLKEESCQKVLKELRALSQAIKVTATQLMKDQERFLKTYRPDYIEMESGLQKYVFSHVDLLKDWVDTNQEECIGMLDKKQEEIKTSLALYASMRTATAIIAEEIGDKKLAIEKLAQPLIKDDNPMAVNYFAKAIIQRSSEIFARVAFEIANEQKTEMSFEVLGVGDSDDKGQNINGMQSSNETNDSEDESDEEPLAKH